MKTLLALLAFSVAAMAQPVCNLSNAQVDGYVLTATSTGGKTCSWQTGGGGGGGAVSSVFGRTGAVVAQTGDYAVTQITGAAPLASPAFTGNPTAPTQTGTDNSTKLATTAFVQALIGSGGCPTCLLGATPVNHGVAFGSATQAVNFSTAGTAGQTLLSGGASANGAYGALNLAGGSSIVTGILPAGNLPTATSGALGLVQGDGSTLAIGAGVMSCTTMTTSQIGCAKVDGTTITISGGMLHANAGTLTGSGTLNTVPLWTGSNILGNSSITDNGSIVSFSEPVTIVAGNAIQLLRSAPTFVGPQIQWCITPGTCDPSAVGGWIIGPDSSNNLAFRSGAGGSTADVFHVDSSGTVTVPVRVSAPTLNFTTSLTAGGVAVLNSTKDLQHINSYTSGTSNFQISLDTLIFNRNLSNTAQQLHFQVGGNEGVNGGWAVGPDGIGNFALYSGTTGVSIDVWHVTPGGNMQIPGAFSTGSATVSGTANLNGQVKMPGLTSGASGIHNVCVDPATHIVYDGGCSSGGSVSAPLTLGSNSFTGNQALQAIGAGSMSPSADWSPMVGLLGPDATSTTAVYDHIIDHATSGIGLREAAVVGATVVAASDTAYETNGVIGMVVTKRASTITAVAGSFFADSIVTGGIAMGVNVLVQDADSSNRACAGQFANICNYASNIPAMEIDVNQFNPNSTASGINFGITYLNGHSIAPSHAISFNVPGSSPANYFDASLYAMDGSANVFARVGRGATISDSSQFLDLVSGSAAQYTTRMWSNSDGSLVILGGQTTGNTAVVTVDRTGNLHLYGPSAPGGGNVEVDSNSSSALYAPYGQLYTGGSGANTMIGSLSVGAVSSNSSITGARYLGQGATQSSQDSLVLCQSAQVNCFLDRDYPGGGGSGGQINIGYNTPRALGSNDVVTIYDNSSNRNVLFKATSQGSSSGSDAVSFLPSGGTATFGGGINASTGAFSSSASNAVQVTGGITVGGTGIFTNFVRAPIYQIGLITVIDTGLNIVNAQNGTFSGTVAAFNGSFSGLIVTGGISAGANITSTGSFNCGLGCSGYQINGTIMVDSGKNITNAVSGTFSGVISTSSTSNTGSISTAGGISAGSGSVVINRLGSMTWASGSGVLDSGGGVTGTSLSMNGHNGLTGTVHAGSGGGCVVTYTNGIITAVGGTGC